MTSRLPELVRSPAPVMARDRLIVALDVPTAREARELVSRIGDAAGFYKVGLQLFTAEGPGFVRELAESGRRVFLDLKLHDIPNTVSQAVKSATELGASMLTVHASGGVAMLQAAAEAAGNRLSLLAVTVLTSMSDDELSQIGERYELQAPVRGRNGDCRLRWMHIRRSPEKSETSAHWRGICHRESRSSAGRQ